MSEKTEYSQNMKKLIDISAEIEDLSHVSALLGWDQQTNMPTGGAEERGLQLSAIGKIIHEKLTSLDGDKFFAELEEEVGDLNAETDEARAVKVAKRQYEKQTKVPLPLLMETIQTTTMAHEKWVEAKTKSDFSIFQPYLEKIVDLRKQYAALFEPYDHVYDPLLDDFEPGMKTAEVKEIFEKLISKDSMDFLNFVITKNRDEFFKEILEKFESLKDEYIGVVKVDVITAFDFAEDQKTQLQQRFESYLKKKARLTFKVDKKNIGGFVAKVGDTIYNASVFHQLGLLKKHFLQSSITLN